MILVGLVSRIGGAAAPDGCDAFLADVVVAFFAAALRGAGVARSESNRSPTALSSRIAFNDGCRNKPDVPVPRMKASTTNIGGNHSAPLRSLRAASLSSAVGFDAPASPMRW